MKGRTYKASLTKVSQYMKKVLVVEDHPDMRWILTRQVERLGFLAISAEGGQEGVEKALKEKPNIILMDILMPGMDGMEATRILRANPETRDIPILAVTVLITECELNRCVEAGCNDYIVKPFTTQELLRKMAEFIPSSSEAPLSWGVA